MDREKFFVFSYCIWKREDIIAAIKRIAVEVKDGKYLISAVLYVRRGIIVLMVFGPNVIPLIMRMRQDSHLVRCVQLINIQVNGKVKNVSPVLE